MLYLSPSDIHPVVRIANDHPVTPGQSWSNRSIPDLQLILAIEGEFAYRVGEAQWSILPGEVLLIEPGIVHTFYSCEVEKMGRIAGIHLELIGEGAWAAGDYRLAQAPERITRVYDVDYLQQRFVQLAAVFAGYSPYRDLLANAIAHEIVLMLMSQWRNPSSAQISPRMQEMIRFIRTNLKESLTRQTLADAFSLSPEHVNLLFRRELGMTPSSVINRERIMLAYRLLHEQGYTVKEAAFAVGFSDPFYFSRVFKQILGVSPSQAQ